MKHIRSLYRSPLKTVLTLLLLAAAAFLFLYNLSEYSVSDREYREARDKYEGVLTVEAGSVPDNSSIRDYFLLTDETNPGNTHELLYEDYHQQSLGAGPLAAALECGNVSLLRGQWNREYIQEFCEFPLGAHDDQVDATSGAFAELQTAGPSRIDFF